MALRDQPYLPLYVQDYLTDEKLSCCSLSTQGVYIRILCVFHKSETYGGILFKQIPKQKLSSMEYFVFIIAKMIGVDKSDVADAIEELLFFKVLTIEQRDEVDYLFQKRMDKDFKVSEARSKAAKSGGGNPKLKGKKSKNLFKQNSKQTPKQIPEYENEYENKKEEEKSLREEEENNEINFDDVYNTQWMESIYRMLKPKITWEGVLEKWKMFKIEMKARDDLYREPDDYRRHFPSWLKKEIERAKTTKEQDDNFSNIPAI